MEPGLAGIRMSPPWILLELRMVEVVVITGAIKRAKLQSSRHRQQTPKVLQAGRPCCRPTNSVKALKGNVLLIVRQLQDSRRVLGRRSARLLQLRIVQRGRLAGRPSRSPHESVLRVSLVWTDVERPDATADIHAAILVHYMTDRQLHMSSVDVDVEWQFEVCVKRTVATTS